MRIAIIGNFDKELSPVSHGGTELFTYSLVQGLIEKPGITSITVFGVGKNYFNSSKVNFIQILPEERAKFIKHQEFLSELSNSRLDFDAEVRFGIASKIMKNLQGLDIDILHDNSTSLVFTALSKLIPYPILTTLHTNVMSPSIMIPYCLDLLDPESKKQYFVSIAKHQGRFAKEKNININILQTVYNGLDIKNFSASFETDSKNPGLWLGRVNRKHDKGIKQAVEASEAYKRSLNIVCQIDDQDYYSKEIEPLMGDYCHIQPGPKSIGDKNKLYAESSYFLYPIQWEEPFGLVFLEAMASGTPVIAFGKGAVPEVIEDGKTGFIVNASEEDIRGDFIIKKTGVEGLGEAMRKISEMPKEEYRKMREASRQRVEDNFTIEKMVDGYEEVYKKILAQV